MKNSSSHGFLKKFHSSTHFLKVTPNISLLSKTNTVPLRRLEHYQVHVQF